MQNTLLVNPEPLRRSARRLELGFSASLILTWIAMATSFVILLAAPAWIGTALAEALGYPLETPQIWQSAALVSLVLFMLGSYAAVFHAAMRVCQRLVQGAVDHAAMSAKRLSQRLWLLLGVSVASNTLGILVATAHAGPGQRALSISLGSAQLTFVIAALIAAFLARAFVLGAALWQDHHEIV